MSRGPLVALLVVLASLPAAFGEAAGAPADLGCASRWWPQPRQNACGNASAANAAAPSPATVANLELAWTYRPGGARMSQPIVWAEPQMRRPAVYVVAGGRLHAVDLATGRLRWTARAGMPTDGAATPVAHGDVLLAVSSAGVVRRYVPRSGHIVWQRTTGSRPQVVAGGNWYSLAYEAVWAFEERTGRARWERLLEGLGGEVAAVGGRVYATGDVDGYEGERSALHALDARSGKTVWTARPQTYAALFSPVVADGRVFVRSLTGEDGGPFRFFLDAFSVEDGKHLWRAPAGTARGFWFTPPAADGSLVVQPTEDGRLYALDAATGAPRWSVAADNGVRAAIVNGLVWAADESGRRIVALDATTGRRLWTSPPFPVDERTGRFAPSPVVAGGFLVLGSSDGRLLAYRVPAGVGS